MHEHLVGAGSTTATFTNMPGRRRSSALATVAWIRTLRVAVSTWGLMAVIFPSTISPAGASVVTRTGRPRCDLRELLLRQEKVDENRVERLQRDDRVPRIEQLAEIDQADAEAAGKGARMVFFAIIGANVVGLGPRPA